MTARDPYHGDRSGRIDEDTSDPDKDLWFLPGPVEDEPDFLPPGPRAEPDETSLVDDWARAEASCAALLADVALRFGALEDRLCRGPAGWQHRIALNEGAELSWFAGDRVGADRIAIWLALRLAGVQEDTEALARVGWAVRRLSGGPSPEFDPAAFLDRRDPGVQAPDSEPLADRAAGWVGLMNRAQSLHALTRACMGYHLWSLAGLGRLEDRLEAAVTASRIAGCAGLHGYFAPLAMGGARGLRASGPPERRLALWLKGMAEAIRAAMRHLDDLEVWSSRAEAVMAPLSGRTPPALRSVLTEWPLVSAPMAESLTGASRATVQRNLAWMEDRGLIREMTGQGRFRMWRAAL